MRCLIQIEHNFKKCWFEAGGVYGGVRNGQKGKDSLAHFYPWG